MDTVVQAVYLHFPLIRAAQASRGIAAGENQAAWGAFDHKLGAYTENQPLGFYETYRQGIGFKRDTLWGGQVFAGYRVGRGNFEPWYQERQTNAGGEFKSGLIVPLAQNRWIDPNRAELWRAQLERRRVEPAIQAEIIASVFEAKVAYWLWIAAAENRTVVENLLEFAQERNSAIERQVQTGDRASIELVDNRQQIVSRESKLIEANRKLLQSGIKLSLFLRTPDGCPWIPDPLNTPPGFPELLGQIEHPIEEDVALAQQNRPETRELDIIRRQFTVDLRQAENLARPELNGTVVSSQDMGEPTSSKRDKSEFELMAGMYLDVPLQRNKAIGKMRFDPQQAGPGHRQTADHRRQDRHRSPCRPRRVAGRLRAGRQDQGKHDLAVRMELAEQKAFELGASNLLDLNIREQKAADAAAELVAAKFEYFVALAEYQAALGFSESNLLNIPELAEPLPAEDLPADELLDAEAIELPAEFDLNE